MSPLDLETAGLDVDGFGSRLVIIFDLSSAVNFELDFVGGSVFLEAADGADEGFEVLRRFAVGFPVVAPVDVTVVVVVLDILTLPVLGADSVFFCTAGFAAGLTATGAVFGFVLAAGNAELLFDASTLDLVGSAFGLVDPSAGAVALAEPLAKTDVVLVGGFELMPFAGGFVADLKLSRIKLLVHLSFYRPSCKFTLSMTWLYRWLLPPSVFLHL